MPTMASKLPSPPAPDSSLKPLTLRAVASPAAGRANFIAARRPILPTHTAGTANHARHHVPVRSQP
jgi:hypothetical protein